MLDECFLDDLDHVITATTHTAEVNKDFGQLLKGVVTMESFIDELLFNDFPELVILQVGSGSTFDSHKEGAESLTVQSGHLLLDHRQDQVPEFGALLKTVGADEPESVHDLLGSHHFITEFLVNEGDVWCVLGMVQCEVDLVEGHVDVVVEVVVATRVNLARSHNRHH